MPKQSAGILLYRQTRGELEVFLVHPGGPFFAKKDEGAWTIPKGEFTDDEAPLDAAKREFEEETSFAVDGEFRELQPRRLKSGKLVHAWAVEGDVDAAAMHSNEFELEWPPRSGKRISVPEADRGGWFSVEEGMRRINPAQAGFIQELVQLLK
jgi:predicted NUDIX family NTP pyrophosphohydrolase